MICLRFDLWKAVIVGQPAIWSDILRNSFCFFLAFMLLGNLILIVLKMFRLLLEVTVNDREVYTLTGKLKNNVKLFAAGGWCGCCSQGGLGTRAVNEPLISFTLSWGPSPSLLEAFSGLSRVFLGFLGFSWALFGLHQAREGPRKPQKGLEKAPKALWNFSKVRWQL